MLSPTQRYIKIFSIHICMRGQDCGEVPICRINIVIEFLAANLLWIKAERARFFILTLTIFYSGISRNFSNFAHNG